MFGHVKGAFTGAVSNHTGLFREADGGTLFLDEVGDLDISLQVKVLRALQEKEVRPVGGKQSHQVDVRVITATHRNLVEQVDRNQFRSDLYYRIAVIQLYIPPLRERKDDIHLLVKHFIKKYNKAHSLSIKPPGPSVLKALMGHSWPGNIRELENIIERSMILASGDSLDIKDMQNTLATLKTSDLNLITEEIFSIKKISRIIEEKLIFKALQKTGGNKSRAAKLLEISYPSLLSKIDDYKTGDSEKQ